MLQQTAIRPWAGANGQTRAATVTYRPSDDYYRLFYRPYLGAAAFALWDLLLALDFDRDGRVDQGWRIDDLALLMGMGDRYTITGRNATKTRPKQKGAIEALEEAGLITVKVEGWHKARRYWFTVDRRPPILDAEQVATMGEDLALLHGRYFANRLGRR